MATGVVCPDCNTNLKLAVEPAPGRKIKCPSCQAIFTMPGGAPANTGVQTSARRAPPMAEPERVATKKPARRRDDDDFDDDLDDDNFARRASRRREKKGNTGLVVGLIIGGVVLLAGVVIGVVAIAVRMSDDDPPGALPGDPVAAFPNNGPPPVNRPPVNIPPVQVPPVNVPPPQDEGAVTVHFSGVTDELEMRYVESELKRCADRLNAWHRRTTINGNTTFTLGPVADATAFSRKLDWLGTVTRVQGRDIHVQVKKLTLPPEFARQRPPANQDPITQALFEAQEFNGHFKRKEALERLRTLEIDEKRRREVCKALEGYVTDKDHFVSQEALKTLGVWADKETVPFLIRLLQGIDKFKTKDVIPVLAATKDERAIEPIADTLSNFFAQSEAAAALKAFGAAAEKPVIKQLNSADHGARRKACEILGVIGTKECLPHLLRLSRSDIHSKTAATGALEELFRRGIK